jgi:hypothetical protein
MSDTHAYLHVTIQLVRGEEQGYIAAMTEMRPVLEECGWRLVCALTPTIGRLGAVYHVWSVPSADAVGAGLAHVRSHERAEAWRVAFARSIADEALQLVQPTSYSPVA